MAIDLIVNESELKKLGENLANYLINQPQPLIIYLQGDLGTGKTTFARAFIQQFNFTKVKSPTYSIVQSYPIDVRGSTAYIHHFDCYRLNSAIELDELGLDDYLIERDICLFEWAEKVANFLPKAQLTITLCDDSSPKMRKLSIQTTLPLEILSS